MTISNLLKQRVRYAPYLKKVKEAHELIPLFKNGQYLGWSGFTGVGTPKAVPEALIDHVEKNNLQGKLRFNLFVGASAGPEENRWAEHDMIIKRAPHQVGKPIAKAINQGRIEFFDKHLSMFPQDLTYGFYTRERKDSKILDYTIIEATAIKEDGSIVPGPSVGGSPEFITVSDKVIIEVNTATPSFEGIHDIDMPVNPPFRKPYPYLKVDDKCGVDSIPVDPEKVVAIVESTMRDQVPPNTPSDDMSRAIAGHLVEFFRNEVKHGRLPENLLPLQSGIGNIANAVIEGLAGAQFKHLTVWTEVLQDSFLDLFENGSLDYATATSVRLTEKGFDRAFANWENFKHRLCLRSQVVSNNPEMIRRLGVIAMNTPVEVDIYAHANSTNVNGSRMLNGLGGSADFLRNAKLSIMHAPSARPTKVDPTGISTIVPMASHVDQTEHDLDILVTDQGLADLRGLSPKERAREIINKCAHPDYQALLTDYLDRAEHYAKKHNCLHEPHMLKNAFKFHTNLAEKGTMKVDSWEPVD
ncbi:CQS_1a_G0001830.mRNA.1.CDS.1 [Saccharomyces cerevisiae]|nr:CQS_1a_G0001830.mRNA.1.CDS.1 [Saccharomyces cerevisiae]CAI7136692.1 CQS_1a_G0001830.mRNA.1.CDS.1 [Saccharomyces cerevisiae]